MKTSNNRRKAKAQPRLKTLVTAIAETSWAILVGFAAGIVGLSIHAKGAPLRG